MMRSPNKMTLAIQGQSRMNPKSMTATGQGQTEKIDFSTGKYDNL